METTEAIILSTAPYAETTLLVRLLTPEHGVVRALAKGARRGSRRTQAAYEPLALVQAQYRLKQPDGLGTLGEVKLKEGWSYLRRDLERLAYAGVALETLGCVAADSPADTFYFAEGVRFLHLLRAVSGPGSLTIALLLRLLHHAGYPPRAAEAWAVEAMPPVLVWDFEACRFNTPRAGDSPRTMRLPGAAVRPLLEYFEQAPELDGGLQIGGRSGPVLLRWLIACWEDHLHTRLKAAEFLEKMVLSA